MRPSAVVFPSPPARLSVRSSASSSAPSPALTSTLTSTSSPSSSPAPSGTSSVPVPPVLRLLASMLALLMLLVAPPARAATRVQFEVDMREEIRAGRFDPAKDQVGVRGGSAPLNWDRPLMARPDADKEGWWSVGVSFERAPAGNLVAYKFRIERTGQPPDAGWESGANRSVDLMAPELLVSRVFGEPGAPISLSRAGQIDRVGPLASRFVTPREVQVWTPPNYLKEPERRYPVLYLHDGQNVFDAAAAGAEWGVDETAQHLVVTGQIQPLIIVAVSNSPQRTDDYTPTRATVDAVPQGGKAADYARYLIEELKPVIDARYRTRPDARHTAVGGSSFGGLMSLWLAMHRNDVFGAALVVSPSLWWDDEFALRDVARTPLPMGLERPRLWVDMGDAEGRRAIAQLRQLRQQLLNRGWQRSSLNYLEVAGGSHDEASWAARVEPMLRFLDRQAWPATPVATPGRGQDPFPPVMPRTEPLTGGAR